MKTGYTIKEGGNVSISGNSFGKINLSGNTTKDVKKVTKLMVDSLKRSRTLWRKEINHWQSARMARYNIEMPRTYLLHEVYDDVMMDGHLTGITENRTLRTTNKNYVFAIDGKKDDKLSEFIEDKEWFEKTIQAAHESVYRGYALIFPHLIENNEIKDVTIIPHGQVVPEKEILLKDYTATEGINFKEIPDILWYAQFYGNVGLLEKAAPYTILKRHSWGSWDEFEELFGVPIRIAKIASQSDVVKNEVAGWLEEMGSAAYGVFPIGTEVDIKENSKADAFKVFYMKIEALDKELSKLVLHQTMTTESGSSRSQGETHENTLNELVYADEKRMLSFLNNRLVPAMRSIGYAIPDNARIIVEQTSDPEKQIKIDAVLMGAGFIPTKQYIEETYGIDLEDVHMKEDKTGLGKE